MKSDDLGASARIRAKSRFAMIDELVHEFDHDRAQLENLSTEAIAARLDREWRHLMRAPRAA